MTVNKAILLGHSGKDPEIRYTADNKAIANFSIATTESYKDKEGEWQNITEWHNITAFGKLAEIVEKVVKKGSQVYIEGKIKTNKYTDKNGQDKYSTIIIADVLRVINAKSEKKDDDLLVDNKDILSDAIDDNDIPF